MWVNLDWHTFLPYDNNYGLSNRKDTENIQLYYVLYHNFIFPLSPQFYCFHHHATLTTILLFPPPHHYHHQTIGYDVTGVYVFPTWINAFHSQKGGVKHAYYTTNVFITRPTLKQSAWMIMMNWPITKAMSRICSSGLPIRPCTAWEMLRFVYLIMHAL